VFWASTLRELYDEIEALVLRRQDARNRDVTLAWMTVNLAAATWATGRVPELQGLLMTIERPRGPQSLAEQKAALHVIAQQLGRPLQTKRKVRH
jgi:hypothetical protein